MATVTDPARELSEIAEKLSQGAGAPGETFLSERFGVKVWSTDFVKIIACILERADLVGDVIRASSMDSDHQANALSDLERFKSGFTGNSLRQAWNTGGNGLSMMRDHGRPLQYLSPTVRAEIWYPKLDESEVKELIDLIDAYLTEIRLSDEEPEFVRRAIDDGLSMFRFQLDKLGWMGSGYVLAAFREVVLVYEASKRQYGNAQDFDANSAIKGLGAIVQAFKKKVDDVKGWADSAEAVWKWYQIGSSIAAPFLLAGKV